MGQFSIQVMGTLVLGCWVWGGTLLACGSATGGGPGAGGQIFGADAHTSGGGAMAAGGAGGQTTGGSGSSPGGRQATESLCFEPDGLDLCEDGLYFVAAGPPIVLAEAEDILPGGEFRALEDTVALIEAPAGEEPARFKVLSIDGSGAEGAVVVHDVEWPGANGTWSVLHASTEPGVHEPVIGGPGITALACDASGCLLLGDETGDGPLLPLGGTELPPEVRPHRLSSYWGARLCAFGEQIHCWQDGGWTFAAAVPTGAGSRFTHVLPGPVEVDPTSEAVAPGAAATDLGAVLLELEPGEWSLVRPPSEAGSVVSLERDQRSVSAVFANGLWIPDLATEAASSCPDTTLSWVSPVDSGRSLAVDEAGRAYVRAPKRGVPARWCRAIGEPTPDIIESSLGTCLVQANLYAITSSALLSLLGEPTCAID